MKRQMKKLNTYLMGIMSVAVCLFSVACSSDDEETTPQKNGKVVTVEAVFANDGVTRAAIGDPNDKNDNKRYLSFEEGDVLRLVKKSGGEYKDFTASISDGKCHFYGELYDGTDFDDYTAYLLSDGISSIPSNTIGEPCPSLNVAFKSYAIISGEFQDTDSPKDGNKDKYVLSLNNAFVYNSTGSKQTFYYGTNESKTEQELSGGNAIAVPAGTYLKKSNSTGGTQAVANTIYVFN